MLRETSLTRMKPGCFFFFCSLPDKTHAFKGEKCTGGKQAKDRLTVLVAANMDGSENEPYC